MQDQKIASTLQAGKSIHRLTLRGNTMSPIIMPGQSVKIEPSIHIELKTGDLVLCKIRDSYYVHKIVKRDGSQFQIGNNHGFIKGWIPENNIYGIVTEIFD